MYDLSYSVNISIHLVLLTEGKTNISFSKCSVVVYREQLYLGIKEFYNLTHVGTIVYDEV